MDKLSRRSFLKLTGQGAVGLALASNPLIAYASSDPFYTLTGDDLDWGVLVGRLNVGGDDPIGTLLLWNPEIKNPYNLQVGQKLRIPDRTDFPAYPKYNDDSSKWKVIASYTSVYGNSPDYRVHNIITGSNAVNNWFNDYRHPVIKPREKFSLNSIIGDTTEEKGYEWGFAIEFKDGKPRDVPALGGGICQIPTTIFSAVLNAGLNVLERTNHLYYPYWWYDYPEGFGIDATINSPYDPDFVSRNMYDFPVRLWLVIDENKRTLRADVYGPPEINPYPFKIEGPFLTSPGPSRPTSSAGKITTAAKTIVTQYVNVGDSVWERNFPSTYVTAPYK